MIKFLLNFFGSKPQLPEVIEVPRPKQKINVKKAFATIRLKNGENIISKEFYGHVTYEDCGYPIVLMIHPGKDILIKFFEQEGDKGSFLQVTNERLVRGTDIMDIIGIVEADYEVEI